MKTLLQLHFPFSGPFGEEMSQQLRQLAESINQEPGFLWKVWTESEAQQLAGGIYLFASQEAARAYLQKHSERMQAMGVAEIHWQLLNVNEKLTSLNHGQL